MDGFNSKMQFFKFLHSSGWGYHCYELWHCVIGYLIPCILSKHNGLIFKIQNAQEEQNTQWWKSLDVTQSSDNYMIEDKTGLKNIFWQKTLSMCNNTYHLCVTNKNLWTFILTVLTLSETARVVATRLQTVWSRFQILIGTRDFSFSKNIWMALGSTRVQGFFPGSKVAGVWS